MKRPVAYAIYLFISIIPAAISIVMAYGVIAILNINHIHDGEMFIMAGAIGGALALTLFAEFHSKDKEMRNSN